MLESTDPSFLQRGDHTRLIFDKLSIAQGRQENLWGSGQMKYVGHIYITDMATVKLSTEFFSDCCIRVTVLLEYLDLSLIT